MDVYPLHNPAARATMWRVIAGPRRPEHAVVIRDHLDHILLHSGPRRHEYVQHRRTIMVADKRPGANTEAMDARDMFAREMMMQRDTVLLFAGPEFCDLTQATAAPDVLDLGAMAGVGNHTVIVTFARNLPTAVEGDALVGMVLHRTEGVSGALVSDDGRPRLLGSVVHEDRSVSTFMRPMTEVGPDLFRVDWTFGIETRIDSDMDTENRLIMNAMGLLAAQSVTEVSEWNHYPKAARAAAKRAKRKLPIVNVVTLGARVQTGLDDHQDAKHVEREGWWPVKGHFRTARVGPGRTSLRQIYIHPCVKGNRQGPNIGRVQVKQTA